jgi:transposase InsO family protein
MGERCLLHSIGGGLALPGRTDLFYYIEVFYNRRRLYSALGYISPETYEQLYDQGADLP